MWQRKAGLPFNAIPCFACPSSLYLCGLLAVPQVKHGNEARVYFFVLRFCGIANLIGPCLSTLYLIVSISSVHEKVDLKLKERN